jgi:hypothetical protein
MQTVWRIAACLLCVVLHASGTPNSTVATDDPGRCLSFTQAEALGIDVEELRGEYPAAVEVFPGLKTEIAAVWTELQLEIRHQLEASGVDGLGGNAVFSIFFFEPDGRIARVIHRGLDPEQEKILCEVVDRVAEEYRFPLQSDARFSQCGTTHFKEN